MDIEPGVVHANGTDLTYVEIGSGDVVLLIHGTLTDYHSWGRQLAQLSARYRVIAYSRRLHWPNSWPVGGHECSVEVHAADLIALINALDLGSPFVVGSSYGALTALTMAATHPTRAKALVLGERPLLPWLNSTPEGASLLQTFQTNAWYPARDAFRNGDYALGARQFMDGVLGEGGFDQMPEPAVARMMDNAPAMGSELETPFEVYTPHLTCAQVEKIASPVLLVTGEHSPPLFIRITDALEHCLAAAERAVIPNATHVMHAGNPEAYNRTVLDFLARH
jgi:non-heme chloroperoxidase